MSVVVGLAIDFMGAFLERVWVSAARLRCVGPLHVPSPAARAADAQPTRSRSTNCAARTAVPVNWRHDRDRVLGAVRALERDGRGGLWAVAEVDSELPYCPEPLYWSSRDSNRAAARGPWTLKGLAVTPSPGGVCLEPLEIFDGKLADTTMRRDDWVGGLMKRTAATVKEHRYRYPAVPLMITGNGPAATAPPAGPMLTRGRAWADEDGRLHGAGGWWHSSGGRILSVR